MANGNWWFKFDYRIWRTDSSLRRCSLETRGFWLELLCAMYESKTFQVVGSYEEIGWLVGCDTSVVARCVVELQRTNTADVTLGNGIVTLLSRRLKSELSSKEKTRLRVERHRSNTSVTPQSKSKSKKKEKEEELREASASPPPAPETSDTLEHHPLISGIKEVSGRHPPKEIWDELTGQVGANVDQAKLKTCFTKWRAQGFNPQNFQGWAVDWYLHGIPKASKGVKANGASQPKTFRQQRNDEAKREGEFVENLRRAVEGISGNDDANSDRLFLTRISNADTG